jgi:hypothetical protein
MMVWGEGRSDNMMSGVNVTSDASLYNILKENLTAMNGYTTWDGFYDVINRCNTVLKYAPGVAQIDPAYTDGDLKANIAEVSALRDLCYFYLIRTFRDVPYSEEAFTDDDQVMDLPATPFETVLSNLIADLEKIKYSTNPYSVNRMTLAAGIASLKRDDYNADNCRRVMKTREATVSRLKEMGFEVLPSLANFVFARRAGTDGAWLYRELKARGVLVRHFDAPRIRDFLRITIGTDAEMDVLFIKLKEILEG